MAWDTDDDVIYLKSEHYSASEVPSVHAAAIKARGEINGISWIPGVIDPSSNNRSLTDGQRLIQQYRDLGLNLVPAKNAVESGIYRVQELFAQGRIRVFASLGNFFDELRWYRRGEDGKIVKEHDHLMDCLRYLIHEYETHAIVKPVGMDRRTRYRPGSASVGY